MIEFKHLSKRFSSASGMIDALQDVNLSIADGDIFGVIGFSGAGKSTLLRMVNRLEDPTEGEVLINGVNILAQSHDELRRMRKKIGMVFQQFNLLESRTVYENVALPLILNKTDAVQMERTVTTLLQFVGLSDKKDAYPSQLSGGQKQRVGIARALSTNPSILLCDEATSALDPVATEQILQLLKRINKELGITILIVTHEIDVIQKICNRVAVMELGRVVEQGSVLDVFSDPQKEITKRFVKTVIPNEVPQSVLEKLKAESRPYQLLRVRFLGDEAAENLFYHLNHDLGVETNILLPMSVNCRGRHWDCLSLKSSTNMMASQKPRHILMSMVLVGRRLMRNAGTWRFQCAADPGSQTDCLHGFVSLAAGTVLAMIMAFALVLTRSDSILPNRFIYGILNTIINTVRSVPFIILMVFIMPLTKMVVGTRIGTTAALVPLVIFIAPYLTRLFENSLLDVDRGIIEAAQAMGASYFEIIWYFLLPEAKGSLILSITTGTIGLLGATAMAGAIGAGGVGDLALTYGYERMNTPLMFLTVVILIIFVQIIQTVGNHFAFKSRNHE